MNSTVNLMGMLLLVLSLSVAECQSANTITYRIAADKTPLVLKAVELLHGRITERTGVVVREDSARGAGKGANVVLEIRPGIGDEGFAIEGGAGESVKIVGNDERGLIYGVGKFIHTSEHKDGKFTASTWRGVSVPKRQLRGMYFATHFFNFYHSAPFADVQRYVDDLALWGCNTVMVWYDMHHFQGIDDPDAKQMIARLHVILRAANRVGMAGMLVSIPDEGYSNSPQALRANWTAGHDGYFKEPNLHFHLEICPNKPGGMEYILKTRREMIEAFADLDIQYWCTWSYDNGGCTCGNCAPWAANGMLKCSKAVAKLVHEAWPKVKIIQSTWYFDHFIHGEWEAFSKAIGKDKPDFADYLLVDDYGDKFPEYPLKHGLPGGLPMINFPEISMYKMFPWGGYAANPMPRHLQEIWKTCGSRVVGGTPYSEGVFDDLNKVINLQHYWGDREAMETVGEYAGYVACPEAAADVIAAIEIMESQHDRYLSDACKEGKRDLLVPGGGGASKIKMVKAPPMPRAGECLALLERAEAKMTAKARSSLQWKLLLLRAKIDVDIERTKGFNDAISDELYQQVEDLCSLQRAEIMVAVPTRQMLIRTSSKAPTAK